MTAKKRLAIFLAAAAAALLLFVCRQAGKVYGVSYAMACTVRDYEETADGARLTLVSQGAYGTTEKRMLVGPEELQAELASRPLDTSIGAQVLLNVPYPVFWVNRQDPQALTAQDLWQTDAYDDYFRVVDVFWAE